MMRQDSAQVLALQALGWLAGQEGPLMAFLAQSGSDLATLRARAAEPEVLAAVLDFLLTDDSLVIGFCRETGHPFEAPMQARAMLPGGGLPHWT